MRRPATCGEVDPLEAAVAVRDFTVQPWNVPS
jgi:hypothetical protein